MDLIILINTAAAAGLCAICGYVIVHPRIHEGVVVKLGLIMLALGAFGVCASVPRMADVPELRPLLHALTLGNVGVSVAAAGIAWRIWHAPAARETWRRLTGWPELEDPPHREPMA